MNNKIFEILQQLGPLKNEEFEPLRPLFKRIEVNKKGNLFQEGEEFRKIVFIETGLVKKYYLTHEGKEFIKEFAWEGQPIAPYSSILQSKPASFSVEAIEDCVFWSIDYDLFELEMRQNMNWLNIGKKLAEFHFINREQREQEFLRHDASKRLEIFRQRFSFLESRIKKQDIASYLGISPVSLSRIDQVK